jgi:hypothetical protein
MSTNRHGVLGAHVIRTEGGTLGSAPQPFDGFEGRLIMDMLKFDCRCQMPLNL